MDISTKIKQKQYSSAAKARTAVALSRGLSKADKESMRQLIESVYSKVVSVDTKTELPPVSDDRCGAIAIAIYRLAVDSHRTVDAVLKDVSAKADTLARWHDAAM